MSNNSNSNNSEGKLCYTYEKRLRKLSKTQNPRAIDNAAENLTRCLRKVREKNVTEATRGTSVRKLIEQLNQGSPRAAGGARKSRRRQQLRRRKAVCPCSPDVGDCPRCAKGRKGPKKTRRRN